VQLLIVNFTGLLTGTLPQSRSQDHAEHAPPGYPTRKLTALASMIGGEKTMTRVS
jgi:hypothetical protein